MRIALSQAQLVYEVGLKVPAFDIATNAVRTVQAIYEAFAGRFAITPADLYVGNAARLSEWAARLLLFNGQWSVEFRFDGYGVTCNRLSRDTDLKLAVECIRLAKQVAETVYVSSDTQTTVGRLSAWYWCEGGAAAVPPHLSQFAPANLGIAPGFEGAHQVLFNIAGGFANAEERWSTKVLIEPSSVDYGHLFIQIEGRYAEGGKYSTFDEKSAHFSRVSEALLKQAGLEVGGVEREGTP